MLLLASLILGFIGASMAQITSDCPISPVDVRFNARAYLGLWYEMQSFPSVFQPDLKCVTAEYGENKDGTISVLNKGVDRNSSQPSNITGYAYVPDANSPNHLVVVFNISINGIPTPNSGTYHVWETDYINYSLVYSCSKVLTRKTEYAWILSREKTLDAITIQRLVAKLRAANVDVSRFRVTEQNC